jgi:hypothetical protein
VSRRDYHPVTGPGARRTPWRILGVLLTGAALVGSGLFIGRATVDATSTSGQALVQVPHGPARHVAGVPAGYTRDRQGAAAAAVNFIQACAAAAVGGADPATISRITLSETASDAARRMPGARRTAASHLGQQLQPLAVTVVSADGPFAVVRVWAATVFGATQPSPMTNIQWTTFEVALRWESADWKIVDVTDVDGPDPDTALAGAAGVPLPGAYTVFIG